jgi:hypothetical protein
MYKIIICLATINSVATAQTFCNNLQLLGVYAATVSGNINKVHNEFNKDYSLLIARGATIENPISILFEAYLVVPCPDFKTYICWDQKAQIPITSNGHASTRIGISTRTGPVLGFVFRDASPSAFSSVLATTLCISVLDPRPLSLANIPSLAWQQLFCSGIPFDSTAVFWHVR